MAQREGSVYLYLFVVAMVLFVLSTVAFFFAYNEKERQVSEKLAAVAQRERADKDRGDLSRDVFNLKKLIVGDARADTVDIRNLENLEAELKDVEKTINAALADQMRRPTSFTYLTEPYVHFEQIFKTYQQLRDSAVQLKDRAATDLTAGLGSKDKTIEDLNKNLAAERTAVAEAQKKWEDCLNSSNTERARMTQDLQEKEDEWLDQQTKLRRRIKQLENEISALNFRIDKLESEKRVEFTFDDVEPDGKLVNVSTGLGKGWIDLGRRNHLMTGLIFRVFQPIKGGKKLYKGLVEVRKVDEDSAEVRIIEEVNSSLHPMTAGDLVSSPFYDPKEKPVFVFAGNALESKSLTLEYLRAKLKSYGVEIRNKVDINTSFLVALRDYQTMPEFKDAQILGVPILRENDVLQFIGH
jgi:hypothetical protein